MMPRRHLVLLGGGHSHLPVIVAARDWQHAGAGNPVDVTLVSPDARTAYSGMVPGVIAGHYQARECLIDVERLAARSGVRLMQTAAVGLDPRTGLGVAGLAAVTVVAPDCTTADAMATAASVLGPEQAAHVIAGLPGCAARFVRQRDGQTHVSKTPRWPSQAPQSPR